jgi:fatty acid desaturase
MKLKKKDWRKLSCGLMTAALLAVLAAGWGFVAADIWLASTQWLLVAAVLVLFGLYARMES